MELSDDKEIVDRVQDGGVVIQIDRKEYRLTDKPAGQEDNHDGLGAPEARRP